MASWSRTNRTDRPDFPLFPGAWAPTLQEMSARIHSEFDDRIRAMAGALTMLSGCLLGACTDQTQPTPAPQAADESAQTSDPEPEPEIVIPQPTTAEVLESVPGISTADFAGQMQPVIEKTDPNKDQGWSSEAFSEAASERLSTLADLMETGGITGETITPLAASNIQSFPLPAKLENVFADGLVSVLRGRPSEGENGQPSLKGTEAFAKHLASLLAPLAETTERHVKFKLYQVRPSRRQVASTARYHASGTGKDGRIEQTATLQLQWTAELQPRLTGFRIAEYEEIRPVAAGGIRFSDRTQGVFGEDSAFRSQLLHGVDHWRSRIQNDFGIDVNGLQGIALADVNGDGLEDLYVCQHGGTPNKLYVRRKDGTLQDASARSGADWMELTRAALFADFDNDGDQDLALTQGWWWMLMENDGSGRFTKRMEERGRSWLYSLAAADYDLDGDVDLFVCGRNPSEEQQTLEGFMGTPIPYHDANNGGPNLLLRNDGEWKFTDATVESGMDVNNRRFAYAAAWEDYDNDGDSDLYVANDFGRNNLYRNDRGKFTDVAASAGVEDMSAGMGVTWGDFDRDGDMDLHVSNMFSSAGNRIAYQRQFRRSEASAASRKDYQRHARGNTLFQNKLDGTFRDVSESARITMGRWAWGARFSDLNNDGWEDLYVANGFITTDDTGDL